ILEAFHPNRIDLGIGNTVGTAVVNRVLNENKSKKLPYEQSIKDLKQYLSDEVEENHRFPGITANPVISTMPQILMLFKSLKNEKVSERQVLGYTYELLLIADIDKLHSEIKAAASYRQEFQPYSFLSKPKVMIALFVVVGDTNEQAGTYAEALDFW